MSEKNILKLQWLVTTFQIPIQTIAKITGKSRSYVSRIVNGDEKLGSVEFWMSVEKNLSRIMDCRGLALFHVPAVKNDELNVVKGVEKKVA